MGSFQFRSRDRSWNIRPIWSSIFPKLSPGFPAEFFREWIFRKISKSAIPFLPRREDVGKRRRLRDYRTVPPLKGESKGKNRWKNREIGDREQLCPKSRQYFSPPKKCRGHERRKEKFREGENFINLSSSLSWYRIRAGNTHSTGHHALNFQSIVNIHDLFPPSRRSPNFNHCNGRLMGRRSSPPFVSVERRRGEEVPKEQREENRKSGGKEGERKKGSESSGVGRRGDKEADERARSKEQTESKKGRGESETCPRAVENLRSLPEIRSSSLSLSICKN